MTRRTAWMVAAVGAVVAVVGFLRHERPQAPSPAAAPAPTVQLRGVAELPERLEPFLGGTISVRLVSMREVAPERMVLASTSAPAPGASAAVAWVLEVPTARLREAEDALLMIGVEDRTGLRYFGANVPRALRHYQPRGAPGPLSVLGIRLAAVPAT